jgi:serine/threonine-protein kinase
VELSARTDAMIGLEFGGYRVVRQLGEGGMGAVFLAEHRQLARKAAIKILLPALSSVPDAVARFFAEARAASLIEHPGIVEVFDCGELHGRAFILMEYLEGENLAAALARAGKLSADPETAVALAARIADAVGAAHAKQIVHRDLKPENVFLVPGTGGGPVAVKILDFGVAKLMADEPSRTRSGSVVGTPKYMAPEQCRGLKTIDHRADIYSLGCILFELLCGRPPFIKEATGDLLIAHATEAPPSASALEPAVPPALDALVAAMLAKDPADRPPSMAAVAERLEHLRAGTRPAATVLSAPGPVLAETLSRPAPRRPRWRTLAIPVAVAGVVVAGGWGLRPRHPSGPVAVPAPVHPAAPPSLPPPPPAEARSPEPPSISVRRPARRTRPEEKTKRSPGPPARKADRSALLDL